MGKILKWTAASLALVVVVGVPSMVGLRHFIGPKARPPPLHRAQGKAFDGPRLRSHAGPPRTRPVPDDQRANAVRTLPLTMGDARGRAAGSARKGAERPHLGAGRRAVRDGPEPHAGSRNGHRHSHG